MAGMSFWWPPLSIDVTLRLKATFEPLLPLDWRPPLVPAGWAPPWWLGRREGGLGWVRPRSELGHLAKYGRLLFGWNLPLWLNKPKSCLISDFSCSYILYGFSYFGGFYGNFLPFVLKFRINMSASLSRPPAEVSLVPQDALAKPPLVDPLTEQLLQSSQASWKSGFPKNLWTLDSKLLKWCCKRAWKSDPGKK